MEVKLDKRYPLPEASVEQAWAVLRDVRAVAGCMPGAAITEQVDEQRYKGAVKVKVGPATAAFAGDIEVLAIDAAARQVRLLGKGADKAGSTASMELTAQVEPGEVTTLVGSANVIVNGRFAQFGGRMLVQVSDMILAQFAEQFRAAAKAVPVAAGPAAAEVAPVPVAPAADAVAAPDAGAAVATGVTIASANVPANVPAPAAPVAAAPALNAGAIVWQLIRNWVAGLCGRKPAN